MRVKDNVNNFLQYISVCLLERYQHVSTAIVVETITRNQVYKKKQICHLLDSKPFTPFHYRLGIGKQLEIFLQSYDLGHRHDLEIYLARQAYNA